MQINMKEYNLDSFKEKDLYTWEEIINKIEELESEIYKLQEEIEQLKYKPDECDEYDRCEDDYR